MNKAFLSKWWWRYNSEQDHLWRVIGKEKYGEEGLGRETKKPKGSQGTSIWHNIYKTLNGFKSGTKMVVGSGENTMF